MKKVKEGYKMTELGEIPVDWEIYSLNEMLESNLIIGHLDGNHGGLYPKSNEFVEDGVPYIGANCIKDSRIDFANAKYLTSERAKQFKKGVAKNNDVLFAHNATVGPVALLKTELEYVILSTTLTYYRCNQEIINPVYLMYYMQTPNFVNQYSKTMGQTTRNQVPITLQREFKHIIPTKKEQDRISLILSSVDEQIEITDNLIEKTKELKKGLMQKLLTKGIGHSKFKGTEIGKIPEEWEVSSFKDIVIEINQGINTAIEKTQFVDNGVPMLKAKDINNYKVNLSRVDHVSVETYQNYSDRYKIKKDDVLFTNIGSDLGKASIFDFDISCSYAWNVMRIKRNDSLESKFLFYLMNSNYFYSNISKRIKGTGMGFVSKDSILSILVAIPPLKEQNRITSILSSIDDRIDQYESKKEKLQELKKGLMQKLLTGKIRVKV